jgi:hypothetical protein
MTVFKFLSVYSRSPDMSIFFFEQRKKAIFGMDPIVVIPALKK